MLEWVVGGEIGDRRIDFEFREGREHT